MIDLTALASIALAFFIVTVSPGPANIAVATVSMSAGRREGLLFGLGLSCGLAFWGLIAAAGLGAMLQSASWALFFLKIFGGAYLLWLAWGAARSAFNPTRDVRRGVGAGRWFSRGLLLNLSNPKAVVAWMAALSMGLDAGDNAMAVGAATLLCAVLGLLNYTGYALAFSQVGVMNRYQRCRRWVDGAAAGLFAFAGFGLIRSAFSR